MLTLLAAGGWKDGSAQQVQTVGRAAAPIDLSGNWVSLVTDEWQIRMLTPEKGDYRYVPLNSAGRAYADQWDPEKDAAAGDECKGYAAPAIMRLPGRLRITWQDDLTLRVDIDTGTQTRLLHFRVRDTQEQPTWQGYSFARWELPAGGPDRRQIDERQWASLRVDTTNLRPGYLQKNGVPFSDRTVMTEYFNLITTDDGTKYLVVQIFVDDPTYLSGHWVRTVTFRRDPLPDAWNPTACSAY